MELYEAIERRRTEREFEDRPVEEKITKKIIAAGRRAAKNNHLRERECGIGNEKKEGRGGVKLKSNDQI